MSTSCNTCSASGSCNSESCSSELQPTKAQLASNVKQIIGIMSGKGGVGKSSVTGMLAISLQRQGYRVGILDADITGPSIPKIFGIKEKANVNETGVIAPKSSTGIKIMSLNLMVPNEDDPVIWRGTIISQLVSQFWTDVIWGELDYLLIDMPPGTGDVPITIFQSIPINGVVMVSSPQQLAGMVVRKSINMAKRYEIAFYGLIENMAYLKCPDCNRRINLFGQSTGLEQAEKSGIPYLGELPLDPSLSQFADEGRIEKYTSEEFNRIATKLLNTLKS